ncbi:MAG TPA: ATP-binding protein [Lachnospiraceae bacterium]|nr:ATP-binding protein [Lachnospiraceae bacterium]HPF29175.1 ATP-binding protein [Lachnospiraceae bacterium]
MSELRVEAKEKELDRVLEFVNNMVKDIQCSQRAMIQLDVAVEELFVNIAHYAYGENGGDALIVAEMQKESAILSVTFIDSGMPYNPLQKEDPDITLSVEERQIGGLGIYMVKKTMDEIFYQYKNGQNHLTIKKKMSA